MNILSDDMINKWLDSIHGSRETVRSYKSGLRHLVNFMQSRGVCSPDEDDLLNWQSSGMDMFAGGSYNLYTTAARLYFKWLKSQGIYPNIAYRLKQKRLTKKHLRKNLSPEQLSDILSGSHKTRDMAILHIMMSTGVRPIELYRANYEDIAFVNDQHVLFIQGKGRIAKDEYVVLEPHTYCALSSYICSRGKHSGALFESQSNNSAHCRLSLHSISSLVKAAMIRSGYSDTMLTAMSLRHSAATINIAEGGSLQETQQLLRHASPHSTLRYCHNPSPVRDDNLSETRISGRIQKVSGK